MDNWYNNWSNADLKALIKSREENGIKSILSDNDFPREPDKMKGKKAVWYDSDDAEYVLSVSMVNSESYEVSQYVWHGNPINAQDDAYRGMTVSVVLAEMVDSCIIAEEELMGDSVLAFRCAAKVGMDKIASGIGSESFVYELP